MDYILGIDTSSVELGIGLTVGDRPLSAVSRYPGNSHAEHIAQAVDFLLGAAGLRSTDITMAGIAVGPGSFTGLRIGISFLKGFFFGRNARVSAISSLESMAVSFCVLHPATIVCASDARNSQVYWARFAGSPGRLLRETADTLSPVDEFQAAIDSRDLVLTDTLGFVRSNAFDFLRKNPNAFSVKQRPLQRGLHCAMIAARMAEDAPAWTTADCIVPRYLNTVAAEKNRIGAHS